MPRSVNATSTARSVIGLIEDDSIVPADSGSHRHEPPSLLTAGTNPRIRVYRYAGWTVAAKTWATSSARLRDLRRPKLPPPHPAALRRLVEAVVDLAENPDPANVQRYLAMSRALEASRFDAKTPDKRVA